jgi:Sulfotransferase family
MKRPPVIIIGAHRSGTSATTHALQLLGLQIGQDLDNHYESRALQQAHEDYLRGVGAAWFEPAPFLNSLQSPVGRTRCVEYLKNIARENFMSILGYRKDLRGWWLRTAIVCGSPWGWKDPRATLFGPCWMDIFPNARVVHVVRHPVAAASSIRERELKFGDKARDKRLRDFAFCLELALQYVEAGERVADRAKHFRRVRFEDVQADPKNTLKSVAEFCGLRFGNKELAKAADAIRPPNLPSWSQDLEKLYLDFIAKYPRAAKLEYDFPAQN